MPEITPNRILPPAVEALDARGREVHARIASGPRGRVRGPLALWLHSPDFADRAQNLGEFLRYGSSFEPRLSELAILLTARHWNSDFEWYVHAPIAEERGLSRAVIDAVAHRRRPASLCEDEEAIYDFATEMLTSYAVSDASLERVRRLFGERGAIELGAILGYYILGAITLATAALGAPELDEHRLPAA